MSVFARYGGDPGRIVLMGHSAGAQIAALLTLDKQWLGAEGLDPDHAIAGMIGLAAAFLPAMPWQQYLGLDAFAGDAEAKAARPASRRSRRG